MNRETINKANSLVDNIQEAEDAITKIEKFIKEYNVWVNGNHQMSSLFNISLNFTQGGFKEYKLDFDFIDPLYLMQGYLDNAKKALELYQKELTDLKDE